MTPSMYLDRLFAHLYWADDRVLQLLQATPAAGGDAARRLLHHILAAERVWLMRLRGEDSSAQAIWPTLTPDEERTLATSNRAEYRRYLEGLAQGDLERRVEYTNQHGRSYRTAVGDILLHVALHGAYHRGQVARAIRDSGVEPVNTDFITYVRELDESGESGAPIESLTPSIQ